MSEPLAALGAAVSKYGPTGVGLAIGTAAKYGLTLTEGRKLTWQGVVADVLLLGMLGLIAILIADWFHLSGDARVLVGALSAVSSDRLIRLVREQFLRRVTTEIEPAVVKTEGQAEVPAGRGPAASARITVFRSRDERAAPIERLAEQPVPATRKDFDELLKRIDDADQE